MPEKELLSIRGNKISMIFQDPLSALNPIQIVGKQLMEAMYLEHKANKKASRKEYLKIERLLAKYNSSLSSKLKEARNNKDENSRKEAVSALFNDIKEAYNNNEIDDETINKAVFKVLAWKYSLGLLE